MSHLRHAWALCGMQRPVAGCDAATIVRRTFRTSKLDIYLTNSYGLVQMQHPFSNLMVPDRFLMYAFDLSIMDRACPARGMG